jgi:hypothetical protein
MGIRPGQVSHNVLVGTLFAEHLDYPRPSLAIALEINAAILARHDSFMKDLLARLIAYVFLGSFCVVGPVLLAVALVTAIQRTALLYSGVSADGTVVGKRSSGSAHPSYAPVVKFEASNGRTYVVTSDVSGAEPDFGLGQHVPVLYRPDHPESARLEAFAQLWTMPLVVGGVGAGFSIIPAIVLSGWRRRRRMSSGELDVQDTALPVAGTASPAVRWAIGLLLAGCGIALLARGFGVLSSGSSSLRDSQVLIFVLGVLLSTSGVLVAPCWAEGSRLYRGLGALLISTMAGMFGWIAVYGEASGFSSGAGLGHVAMASSGPVMPARIAFGIGSIVFGLASLHAWNQVFRRRE